MGAATRDQERFRGRDDDVALNSATFNGGAALDTGWTQSVDANFRIRYVCQETGGGMSLNTTLELWFTHTQGAGVPEAMTATSALQPAATTQYANGDTTTQVIGVGTYGVDESLGGVDDAVVSGNLDIGANEECEVEFCVTIDSAQVADADTLTSVEIRLAGGTQLNAYTSGNLTITVNEVAGAGVAGPLMGGGSLASLMNEGLLT